MLALVHFTLCNQLKKGAEETTSCLHLTPVGRCGQGQEDIGMLLLCLANMLKSRFRINISILVALYYPNIVLMVGMFYYVFLGIYFCQKGPYLQILSHLYVYPVIWCVHGRVPCLVCIMLLA